MLNVPFDRLHLDNPILVYRYIPHAAANRVIIPVQAQYLPAKGLEQLLKTVSRVQRQINPKLKIDGILLTMVDGRTNFARSAPLKPAQRAKA